MDARDAIDRLGLVPHPEGGWYRETWRADAPPGERSAGSAILFLLAAGERSHWHRVVDATELWLFNAGDPLELRVIAAPGPESSRSSAVTWPSVTARRRSCRLGPGRAPVRSARGRS